MYRMGWILIHFVWQAAAAAGLLAILLQTLRRRRANIRYMTACIFLGILAFMPALMFLHLSTNDPVGDLTTHGASYATEPDFKNKMLIEDPAAVPSTPEPNQGMSLSPSPSFRETRISFLKKSGADN